MSQRPTDLQERHNTTLDSFPLRALICFASFYGAFGPRKQSMVTLVKMSVLSSLTSCLHFESKFLFHPCKCSMLMTLCCLSSSPFPFTLQVAECKQLAQCQIHLRMWKPSLGPPHPPCLLHLQLSAKQQIAMLHLPQLPVNQVRSQGFLWLFACNFIEPPCLATCKALHRKMTCLWRVVWSESCG